MVAQVKRFLTVGHLARRLNLLEFHVREMTARGEVPFSLAGRARLFAEEDLPAIEAAARRLGYLPAVSTASAVGV